MLIRSWVATLAAVVASIAAGAPCPDVTAEPDDGGSLIRIRHKEPKPLTAFMLEIVDYPGNQFRYLEEDLFSGPTFADKEKRFVVPSFMPGTVPDYLKATAAIYEDGATCGPPDKLKLILDLRRKSLQTIRELMGRIREGITAGESGDDLTAHVAERLRSANSGAIVTHVVNELKGKSPGAMLDALRNVEETLAGSKPAL